MNSNESDHDLSPVKSNREFDKDFPVMVTPDDFEAMLYRPEPKTIKRLNVTKPKKKFWDL